MTVDAVAFYPTNTLYGVGSTSVDVKAGQPNNVSFNLSKPPPPPEPPVTAADPTVTINVSPAAGGTVTPSTPTSYAVGTTVNITASATAGYVFTGWTVNSGGVTVGSTDSESFTMPNSLVVITANFILLGSAPDYPIVFTPSDKDELQDAIDEINSGSGKYYVIEIDNDITRSNYIINSANTVTINGKGGKLKHDGAEHEFFIIEGGANVTINDLEMVGTSTNEKALIWVDNATFTMDGSSSLSSHSVNGTPPFFYPSGGAVSVGGGGTFIMKDGSIFNNTLSSVGKGAGVCVVNGEFIMEGGEIYNNTILGSYSLAPDGCGGGVCLLGTASFTMTGGKIHGTDSASTNTASNQGHALYIEAGCTATNGGVSLAPGAHDTTITGVP